MNTSGSRKNQSIADVAAEIAERTSQIAQADSRFGRDFTQFIPGFEGADAVAYSLMAIPECSAARRVLVTPDNSVVKVRQTMIQAGIGLIVPSYGLHRGFLEIKAGTVPESSMSHAGWLDSIEHYGFSLTLDELVERGPIDLIVTGASAVTRQGLRFGMGDFYLDIEWAILRALDLVDDQTLVIACVHEVQLSDLSLGRQPSNLMVNLIVTPSEIHQAAPRGGEARAVTLDWSIVPPSLMQTPPLQEFRRRAARAANQPST